MGHILPKPRWPKVRYIPTVDGKGGRRMGLSLSEKEGRQVEGWWTDSNTGVLSE